MNKILEQYEGLVRMEGFDDCILGVSTRFGQEPIVAYDYNKVIEHLMGDGMTHEDAIDYFEFNQIGSWVGDRTPCFIETTAEDVKM